MAPRPSIVRPASASRQSRLRSGRIGSPGTVAAAAAPGCAIRRQRLAAADQPPQRGAHRAPPVQVLDETDELRNACSSTDEVPSSRLPLDRSASAPVAVRAPGPQPPRPPPSAPEEPTGRPSLTASVLQHTSRSIPRSPHPRQLLYRPSSRMAAPSAGRSRPSVIMYATMAWLLGPAAEPPRGSRSSVAQRWRGGDRRQYNVYSSVRAVAL